MTTADTRPTTTAGAVERLIRTIKIGIAGAALTGLFAFLLFSWPLPAVAIMTTLLFIAYTIIATTFLEAKHAIDGQRNANATDKTSQTTPAPQT